MWQRGYHYTQQVREATSKRAMHASINQPKQKLTYHVCLVIGQVVWQKSTRLFKNPCPQPDGLARKPRGCLKTRKGFTENWLRDSQRQQRSATLSTDLYIQKDRATRLVPGRSLGANKPWIGRPSDGARMNVP